MRCCCVAAQRYRLTRDIDLWPSKRSVCVYTSTRTHRATSTYPRIRKENHTFCRIYKRARACVCVCVLGMTLKRQSAYRQRLGSVCALLLLACIVLYINHILCVWVEFGGSETVRLRRLNFSRSICRSAGSNAIDLLMVATGSGYNFRKGRAGASDGGKTHSRILARMCYNIYIIYLFETRLICMHIARQICTCRIYKYAYISPG